MRELPTLISSRCIGCADCVAICPTDCIAMAGPLPWMPRPGDCISCAACAVICPTAALAMTRPKPA